MNHREVMQQALEALELATHCLNEYIPLTTLPEIADAITALRAALAEQCQCGDRPAAECPGAWEPGCDLGANERYAKVYEPQEPVAWRIVDGEGDYVYRSEPPDNFCLLHAKRYGRQYEALYTHPAPQRQPQEPQTLDGSLGPMHFYHSSQSNPKKMVRWDASAPLVMTPHPAFQRITQRQPLTQYEAWEIWDALADRGKKGEDIVHAFARAIERAHGIGENK